MKALQLVSIVLTGISIVLSTAVRRPVTSITRREDVDALIEAPLARRLNVAWSYLEKRKGGGGSGGGGGGGGGGKSGGSSGSGSGSGSGSSGSGSSGGRSSGGSRNTGNAGSSSPATPSYGGGRYYGGGATSPYRSGGRSPIGGIAPYALLGAGLLIFPGLWLYGAYAYNFNHPYTFHNQTNTTAGTNGTNETLPVTCLCDQYSACGCDDNNNLTYLDSIVGDGNQSNLNSSLVHIGDVNGTKTIVLNGTLPNGTDTDSSSGAKSRQWILEASGFWVVGAIVAATVLTL